MYVADYGNNCIQKQTNEGTFLHKFGTYGEINGHESCGL